TAKPPSLPSPAWAVLSPIGRPALLPPPNRNRLLPISIPLLMGRNPRIRGFGWGGGGVGGRAVGAQPGSTPRPPPPPPPPQGEGSRGSTASCAITLSCEGRFGSSVQSQRDALTQTGRTSTSWARASLTIWAGA